MTRGSAASPSTQNKPSYTIDQAANNIAGWSTGPAPSTTTYFTFAFMTSNPLLGGVPSFAEFSSTQKVQARAAMDAWSDVANIVFTESTSTLLGISFGNYTDAANANTNGYHDSYGNIFINTANTDQANPVIFGNGRRTLVHEIGHAIGLDHPGSYNGGGTGYAASAEYYEDTRQYSVMSYFDPSYTGASYSGLTPAGPQLDDIYAIQRKYGANLATRTGDTVYGFSASSDTLDYQRTSGGDLIFAVWDAGGVDTFNFSGYNTNQLIDLREGSFSNVGGIVGNVAIAIGAVIENAFGGTGNDTIHGNASNNVFYISDGSDTVYGNGGDDVVDLKFSSGSYSFGFNGAGQETVSYGNNSTAMIGISAVRGTSGADTFSQGSEGTRVTVMGGDGVDTFNITASMNADGGGQDDHFNLVSLKSGSRTNIDGGDDSDTINISGFAGEMTIDLGAATMTSDNNAVVSFSSIEGFDIGSTKVTVLGSSVGENITSGHGNSTIYGGGGIDHITGLSIASGAQANFLYGDGGDDVITAHGAAFIFGGADNDTITGSGDADQITGGTGNDTIDAGSGNDIIWGIDGIDDIDGGANFDELKELGTGLGYNYSLVGGRLWTSDGVNTAKLTSVERVTFINPNSPADFSFLTSDAIAVLLANGGSLSGTDLRAAMLAQGMDIDGALTGRIYTANATVPVTGGGNSIIDGTTIGGGVTYASGPLTVTLKDYPEAGHVGTVVGPSISNELFNLNFVEGSGYADVFNVSGTSPFSRGLSANGKGGIDTLSFSSLTVGSSLQVLLGSGTAMTSAGTLNFSGFENFIGSSGDDTFMFPSSAFTVNAGEGTDTADFSLMGGGIISDTSLTGFERFVGSAGNDVFKISKPGPHVFIGGGGYDVVSYEDQGPVQISGDSGVGGAASGHMFSGISQIQGSSGADTFSGSGAKYYGAGGNDVFIGGSGGWFDGGAGGVDVVSYANAGAVNLNAYFNGTQNNFGDYLTGVEKFIGSNGNDVFADKAGITFEGGQGDDAFTLAWGATARGEAGNDVFYVNSSYNNLTANLDGGAGYDQLVIKDGAFSSLDIGAGVYRTYNGRVGTATSIEEVWAPWGTVNGSEGVDVIKITSYGGTYAGNGTANGGGGNDILSADAGSSAALNGGAGNDTITSLGYDRISGGTGDDYIYGGAKTSSIDGGADNDWIYTAASGGYLTNVRGGTGANHIVNTGSSTSTEVYYDFTRSRTDSDGSGLVSVVDQGGVFRVITSWSGTLVTDYIQGVANIFFNVANSTSHSTFYLRPGINYSEPGPALSMAAGTDLASTGLDEFLDQGGGGTKDLSAISPEAHGRNVIFDGESFLVSGSDMDADFLFNQERSALTFQFEQDARALAFNGAFVLDRDVGSDVLDGRGFMSSDIMEMGLQPWMVQMPIHYDSLF